MDSREIVGNGNSLSTNFDDEELFISLNGILFILETGD
jgi:hypothetical protein